jgi:hypothetical protein
VRTGAYLYPWDVDGDPAAADRIAALGVTEVSLAAAYHAVRAVTPFHPHHRIVTRDAGIYYRPAPAHWHGAPLAPIAPGQTGDRGRPVGGVPAEPVSGGGFRGVVPPGQHGSFERAAASLRRAGISVTAWLVVTHHAGLGSGAGAPAVRNAYGDVYPWALCAGSAAVREYAARLAAEAAGLAEADAIELEACGWYGFGHGSAHDKTGVPPGPAGEWLLSLCFCAGCGQAYRSAGADPGELAARVRAAADGGPALPAELATVLDGVRAAAAQRLLGEVLAAARAAAPGQPVLVQADPDPRACGANPGYEPAWLLAPGRADGIVLAGADRASAPGRVAAAVAAAPPGARIAVTLLAVAGLGGDPATLTAQAAAVRAAGATELRFYHAGLAAPGDLAAIGALARLSAAGRPGGRPGQQGHVQ